MVLAVAGCHAAAPNADLLLPGLAAGTEFLAVNPGSEYQEVIVSKLSHDRLGLGTITNGTKVRVIEDWKDVLEERPPVKILILEGPHANQAGQVSRTDLQPITHR